MSTPDLAIVLLNWNGRSLLEQFVPPLVRHTPAAVADIVVLDNGSSDDSLSWLSHNYPGIRTIALPKNYGFAGGYNKGLKQLDYRYYCLLNTDVETTDRWCDRPLELLRSGYDAVQPKLLSRQSPRLFEYAGAAGGFLDKLGYPFCRGRIFDTIESDAGQYDDETEILWASGAAYFVSSCAFWRAGGFDESYFAHMEEIDLSWRIWLSGGKICYTPRSTVYHVGGATLHASHPKKTYLNFRNNLRMIYKNAPTRSAGRCVLLCRLPLDLLASLVLLLNGQPRHAAAVLRGVADFYRSRREIACSRLAPWYKPQAHPPIARYSILWQYHLRGRKFFSDIR